MKKITILIILLLTLLGNALADEIIIPFNCHPKQIQKEFKKQGYKLDLRAEDRTKKSWGFIKSEGSRYIIYTYRIPTNEEFKIITKIVWETNK